MPIFFVDLDIRLNLTIEAENVKEAEGIALEAYNTMTTVDTSVSGVLDAETDLEDITTERCL